MMSEMFWKIDIAILSLGKQQREYSWTSVAGIAAKSIGPRPGAAGGACSMIGLHRSGASSFLKTMISGRARARRENPFLSKYLVRHSAV